MKTTLKIMLVALSLGALKAGATDPITSREPEKAGFQAALIDAWPEKPVTR